MDLLNNKLLPLSKGYVAVINPPAESGEEETIQQMRTKEMALFQKLGPIHNHRMKNYGTAYLQRKLSKELTQKIKEKIPELVLKVTEELESVEQEIDSLDYKYEISAQPVSQRLLNKIKIYQKKSYRYVKRKRQGSVAQPNSRWCKTKEVIERRYEKSLQGSNEIKSQ